MKIFKFLVAVAAPRQTPISPKIFQKFSIEVAVCSHPPDGGNQYVARGSLDMAYGGAAVEVFADINCGIRVFSNVTVDDVEDCSGDKIVSVSFHHSGDLSRFNTHAANLAPARPSS